MAKRRRSIGKGTIATIVVIIILLAGIAGYYEYSQFTKPPPTLTIGFMVGVTTLDPAKVYIQNGAYDVMNNIFDPLVRLNPQTLQLEPSLAINWTANANFTVWTFWLRKNVKFTDGTPFNASAVKFTFDRILQMGTGPAFELSPILNSVNVINNYEVQFVLKKSIPFFEYMISGPEFGIVSPTAVLKEGNNFGTEPVGTGPFYVVKYTTSQIILKANPDYFLGPPKIKTVIINVYQSSSTAALALKSGEIQLIWDPLQAMNPTDIKSLENVSGIVVKTWEKPYLSYLGMYTGPNRPLSNPLLREAIAYAINRSAIIDKVLGGFGYVPNSVVPPQITGSVQSYNYTYNMTKAEQLIKEAGIKPGQVTLIAGYPSGNEVRQAVLTYIASQLSQLGINVQLTPVTTAAWIQGLNNGAFDLFVIALAPDYPNPYGWLQMFTSQAIPNPNRWHYVNPQVDSLISSALSSGGNTQLANVYYAQAQKIIGQQVPAIPLWGMEGYYLMSSKLHGLPYPDLLPTMCLWLYPAYLS